MAKPVVLMIDDDAASLDRQAEVLQGAAKVTARTPDEVTLADARKASVILVDYRIAHWPERSAVGSICLKPADGVAVAAVLRSYLEEHVADKRRAFAIHSGVLHELAGGLPSKAREHAIARMLNLEWVFPKNEPTRLVEQVAILANSVALLPRRWPGTPEKASTTLAKLLAVPKRSKWAPRAIADAESCHPPIHAAATATHGMAFLRWLLHQTIPYPCFLWDDRYVAARLRISPSSFREVLEKSVRMRRALAPASYKGILSGFTGARWWRAGIEHLIWQWTDGRPFDPQLISNAVTERLSPELQPSVLLQPVVSVSADSFVPTDALIEASDAVQIQPDDWPTYAEQAWISVSVASDDASLKALVVPQDRDRVEKKA